MQQLVADCPECILFYTHHRYFSLHTPVVFGDRDAVLPHLASPVFRIYCSLPPQKMGTGSLCPDDFLLCDGNASDAPAGGRPVPSLLWHRYPDICPADRRAAGAASEAAPKQTKSKLPHAGSRIHSDAGWFSLALFYYRWSKCPDLLSGLRSLLPDGLRADRSMRRQKPPFWPMAGLSAVSVAGKTQL